MRQGAGHVIKAESDADVFKDVTRMKDVGTERRNGDNKTRAVREGAEKKGRQTTERKKGRGGSGDRGRMMGEQGGIATTRQELSTRGLTKKHKGRRESKKDRKQNSKIEDVNEE